MDIYCWHCLGRAHCRRRRDLRRPPWPESLAVDPYPAPGALRSADCISAAERRRAPPYSAR